MEKKVKEMFWPLLPVQRPESKVKLNLFLCNVVTTEYLKIKIHADSNGILQVRQTCEMHFGTR